MRELRTVKRPMASRPMARAPTANAPMAVAPIAIAPMDTVEGARCLDVSVKSVFTIPVSLTGYDVLDTLNLVSVSGGGATQDLKDRRSGRPSANSVGEPECPDDCDNRCQAQEKRSNDQDNRNGRPVNQDDPDCKFPYVHEAPHQGN